jgi:hypothetical protein
VREINPHSSFAGSFFVRAQVVEGEIALFTGNAAGIDAVVKITFWRQGYGGEWGNGGCFLGFMNLFCGWGCRERQSSSSASPREGSG